ncbi:hypothetical protein [Phyllobacterium myrsinacearum]|uniref:Uncharacterized protein n=1 Tax=Phyllobacterium myrsinacearum TaxID=28101 RepID=A0A839EHL2_9HYPH|nr:hypothetical protein [Phyllobacterium myrsinacearum]MBA8877034.1 hypothetical protein [Phyllobacterium myrsinacearum]
MMTLAVASRHEPESVIDCGFQGRTFDRLAMAFLWYGMAAFGMGFWYLVGLKILSLLS